MAPPIHQGPRGKPVTRRTVLSRRDALTGEARQAASGVIADRANGLLALLPPGSVVALYAPKGSEADTIRIDVGARARGLRVVYPRVVIDQRELAFHEVAPDELVRGRFGLLEPGHELPQVELAEIAAFVIPGLAFDRSGGRIGWGRGHYDATLVGAAHGALRIGLAFECQIVDHVPRDPHDALLHYVVTELTTYQTPE